MSIWQRAGAEHLPLRHPLGVWLIQRKLATSAYVPSLQARLPLAGKMPFWYVVDFVLAARETREYRVTPGSDFYLVGLLGDSLPQVGGVKAYIYDSKRKQRFSDKPVNSVNLVGTASQPFFHRAPYRFPALSPVLVKVQNLGIIANAGQIVLYGVKD